MLKVLLVGTFCWDTSTMAYLGHAGHLAARARRAICCDFLDLICPSGIFVSSPLCKNISLHPSGKSSLHIRAIPPHHKGRIAIVTDAGCGCGGRGSVLRATGLQGGFLGTCERSPARGREMLFADGKIVWS